MNIERIPAESLIADLRIMLDSTEHAEIPTRSAPLIDLLLDSNDAPALIRAQYDADDADAILDILDQF